MHTSRTRAWALARRFAAAVACIALVGVVLPAEPAAAATYTWAQGTPDGPGPNERHSMVYDSARDRVVMVAANSFGTAQTFEWNGEYWEGRTPSTAPPQRQWTAMAFDSTRNRTILLGGFANGGAVRNDMWSWDGSEWTQLTPPTMPPARLAASMTYDAARDRIVLFGGRASCCSPFLGDTWEYDGTNWVQRFPATSPSPRWLPEMTYDAHRNQVLLFGGNGDFPQNGDFWRWDGTNWTALPGGPPAEIERFTLNYSPVTKRTILFGGWTSPISHNHVWEWDGTQWHDRTPTTEPAPSTRYDHGAAVDGDGTLVVFGGGSFGGPTLSDTWLLTPAGDSDPPVLSFSSVQSPADGFLPAASHTSLPVTVGAAPVGVVVDASDESPLSSLTIGGTAAVNTTGTLWRADVGLVEGANSLAVNAVDEADNAASTTVSVTLDRDLDDDRIANNVDGNSSVTPAVSNVTTPSVRFSDKALGGATSGRITMLPAGTTATISEAPNPAGVTVTVAGPPGQRATLVLDGKAAIFRFLPGTYTLTDPDFDSSVETTIGGPAEIELTVAGAPLLIVVETGEQATVTERDTDGDGAIDEAAVTPAPGDVVTVNGTDVGPTGLQISPLRVSALQITRLRQVDLHATAEPVGTIDPRAEATTLRVGTSAWTIAPGRFVLHRGSWNFSGTIGGASVHVVISQARLGVHSIDVEINMANLAGTANPVPVALTVGDETFSASVTARFR